MNEPATWNPLGLAWWQVIAVNAVIVAAVAVVIYVRHRRQK